MAAKVTLDRDTFKALASETRLDVLRSLDERRKTGSELARGLGLNKATVHEHLQILHTAGLVKRLDEGRKWIYYELTWEGRKILHPADGITYNILLGLAGVTAGGGFIALGRSLSWWLRPSQDSGASDGEILTDAADDRAQYGDSAGAAPEESGGDAQESAAAPPDDAFDAAPEASSDGGGFLEDGGLWVIAAAVMVVILLVVALSFRLRRSR